MDEFWGNFGPPALGVATVLAIFGGAGYATTKMEELMNYLSWAIHEYFEGDAACLEDNKKEDPNKADQPTLDELVAARKDARRVRREHGERCEERRRRNRRWKENER